MLKRRDHNALSLVEVLIFVGLSGLILALLSQVLIPGFQIWKQTQAVSELEQNAMLAEARIETALLQTVAESIAFIPVGGPNEEGLVEVRALSCLDNEGSMDQSGYDPLTGKPMWRSAAVFALAPETGVLTQIRWEGKPLPTTEPFALSQAQLDTISAGTEGRRVAHKVTALRVKEPEEDAAVPEDKRLWTVELEFALHLDVTKQGLEVLKRRFKVLPRIHGEPS